MVGAEKLIWPILRGSGGHIWPCAESKRRTTKCGRLEKKAHQMKEWDKKVPRQWLVVGFVWAGVRPGVCVIPFLPLTQICRSPIRLLQMEGRDKLLCLINDAKAKLKWEKCALKGGRKKRTSIMPVEKWKLMKEIIEVSNLKPHTKLGDAWTESVRTDLIVFHSFPLNTHHAKKLELNCVFILFYVIFHWGGGDFWRFLLSCSQHDVSLQQRPPNYTMRNNFFCWLELAGALRSSLMVWRLN